MKILENSRASVANRYSRAGGVRKGNAVFPASNAFARVIAGALLLLCASQPAFAADDATWLRDQLRQTTVELRRLQDENSALQQRVEKAGSEKPAPAADPQAKAEAKRARADAERLQAENTRLQTELTAALERSTALQQALTASQTQLQTSEQARSELVTAANAAAQCERDNAELARLGLEVTARFQQRGVWDALRGSEPLTGIARARHEALAEKYRADLINATRAGVPAADANSGTQ